MAETGSTPIKGAFFGLLVMFGIFALAGWLFDHVMEQGLENSMLSIGVYAPEVTESQWGKPSHGLQCKLNFETSDPSQFVDTFITVQYKNIAKNDIVLLSDPNEILKAVSAENSDKWKLKLTPVPREFFMTGDEFNKTYQVSVHTIKPGEIYESKIKCQIDNVKKDIGFMSGFFDVTYIHKIDESQISQFKPDAGRTLWTGKIKAGDCRIFLTMPHEGGCNDCHGDADYHHGVLQDCRFCHAEGEAILNDTCIRCHKRDAQKIYGRRRVLGPQGDFDKPSRHISGFIEDSDCLVCHDMTRHGQGTVILADPNLPGKAWTGGITEFCLSCHKSNPPDNVKFPEVSEAKQSFDMFMPSDYSEQNESSDPFSYPELELEPEESEPWNNPVSKDFQDVSIHSQEGTSIYDKSDYRNSDLYKKNVECTDCHRSHGSSRQHLLKNIHGQDDKVRI
jgi:hypothetical protein